jgi:hypothetical protein
MKREELIKQVNAGICKAVTDALIKHKKLGQSIAVWENGKVVIIPAEKIEIPNIKK